MVAHLTLNVNSRDVLEPYLLQVSLYKFCAWVHIKEDDRLTAGDRTNDGLPDHPYAYLEKTGRPEGRPVVCS